MNNTIVWVLTLSIFSIITGIILWRKSVPYGTLLNTFHKIISFALGLVYVLIIYIQFKTWGVSIFPLSIAILTVISFVISVVSGSIMISGDVINRELMITHRITSLLAFILGIYSIYTLNII